MNKTKAPLVLLLVLALIASGLLGCSAKSSSPAEPLFAQADELEQAQDYEDAIQVYQRIREQYPGSFDASYASSWSRRYEMAKTLNIGG